MSKKLLLFLKYCVIIPLEVIQMIFENELKKLIKNEYKSIRAFSQVTKIPYSTIDNIFKRSIQGVNIQVVLKICSVLNIDVEEIKNDRLVLKNALNGYSSGESHTIAEKEIISNYRKLNTLGQEKVKEYMTDISANDKYTAPPELKNKLNA